MKTKTVVESLLNNVENYEHLRLALKACKVINSEDRNWMPHNHSELTKVIEKFKTPHIICLVGKIITIFIIEPKKYNRVYPIIQINGNTSRIRNLSKTKLVNECLKYFNIEDFLPEAMCNQIFWIPYNSNKSEKESSDHLDNEILKSIKENSSVVKEELEMIIFSEVSKNIWTINPNISSINISQKANMTKNKILQNLVKQI